MVPIISWPSLGLRLVARGNASFVYVRICQSCHRSAALGIMFLIVPQNLCGSMTMSRPNICAHLPQCLATYMATAPESEFLLKMSVYRHEASYLELCVSF